MSKKSVYRNVDYDVVLIFEVIKHFKSLGLKPSDITIAFDLDNTLCLFSINGNDAKSLKLMWNKGFYRNLPCFEEVPRVIPLLMELGFNVIIISSCINSEYCKQEKLEWIKHYLPFIPEENIILVNNGENKADYIKDIERTILVDDFYVNIINWYKAGGVAIKRTYSKKDRPIPEIHTLDDLFGILKELGVLEDSFEFGKCSC